MSKIYLASSWRNLYQPAAVAMLRAFGHEVYDFRNPPGGIENGFRWSEIDPEWEKWTAADYRKNLTSPLAQRGFTSDFDGLMSECCCSPPVDLHILNLVGWQGLGNAQSSGRETDRSRS